MATPTAYLLTEYDLNHLKQWFSRYVRSFLSSDDPMIREALILKEKHSIRVCNEILNIGRGLDLTDNELRIAEATALLHDIGRFEQFTRYQTFVDKKSEDHGALGARVLREGSVLAALNQDTRELILKAVSYHNRLRIPEDESDKCIHFSKMLRDADKLDIFNLVSTYYYLGPEERSAAIELDLPDTPTVSEGVIESLDNHEMIGIQHVKSLSDFKMLQMAWVYDINFQPTFRMIQERNYLKKIRDTLPDLDSIDRIYATLIAYIKERL